MGRFVTPLAGWNVRGWSYGQRQDDGQLHTGADLNVGSGDDDLGLPVVAFGDGTVVVKGVWDGWTYGFGNRLLLAHPVGDMTLWGLYAHLLDGGELPEVGTAVAAGEQMGRCGKSGRQTWAHVHFELRYQGPEVVAADYWGGGLPVERLSELYADPFTLMTVLGALPEGKVGVSGEDLAALEADRDFNFRLKMLYEGELRRMEGRRVRVKSGTVEQLIAQARR